MSAHLFKQHYINGEFCDPDHSALTTDAGGAIDVHDASTEQLVGSVALASSRDVDRAVRAAAEAGPSWAITTVPERQAYLRAIAAGLEARRESLAKMIASEVGTPITRARAIQLGLPIAGFRAFADLLDTVSFEHTIGTALVLKEPVGVVAAITPWNYPLHQIACKLGAALAAGCTVVLKPSELAPLNAFVLAEVIHEVGLPKGVFNMLCGPGATVGEALCAHPLVDMISFTGSTRAGKQVSTIAAQRVKKVALELGGKGPFLLLPDADLSKAVPRGVDLCFLNSGQTCSALTRMFVHRSQYDLAVQLACEHAQKQRVGSAHDEQSQLGPLISRSQWERVQRYIADAIADGATVAEGGLGKPDGLSVGHFCKPTVLANVHNEMTIAREEVFGPVLSILRYDTVDEAIALANDSSYGLGGGVWAESIDAAKSVAKRLRLGTVYLNSGRYVLGAPFGGVKQSGYGREGGQYGLDEFLLTKAMYL
jgi:acyl-CoA reductase-like NAD-dependent aldehyde dehydrogenase